MSYTKKKVSWEEHGIQDAYGDMTYSEVQKVAARKQPHREIVKTPEGKELLSKSYFYVDPFIEPQASKISEMDKLDCELILAKYSMCGLFNKPRMFRFLTV